MTSRPTILFCREVPWETDTPVSGRKLAQYFAAAGWQVIWLNPPLGPHDLLRRNDPLLVAQNQRGGEFHEDHAVFAYTPRTWSPHSFRLPLSGPHLAARAWRWCHPRLPEVLLRAGVGRPDVLWLSHPRAFGLPDLFPGVPVVWHMTDDYTARTASPERCHRLCQLNYERADLALFSSPAFARRAPSTFGVHDTPTNVFPHGVDAWRLDPPRGDDPLSRVGHPRVVYVGNTDRADVSLITALAKAGEVEVVVIGSRQPFLESPVPDRLHLLGPRTAAEVGQLLPWCDVGLVSYSEAERNVAERGGNPMKVYEYAAAGLPMLSPPLAVLSALGAPVTLYEDLAGLLRALPTLLAERAELGREARAWASQHTWERRFEEARSIVEQLIETTSLAP